jgi:hypothetical protein
MPFTAVSTWTGAGNSLGIDVDGHHSLAVHVEHPEITLAWGLQLEDRLTFDFPFADKAVSSLAADVLLAGSLVHRESVLSVDGGRSLLPHPRAFVVPSDAQMAAQMVGDTVTDWEYRFVELLDALTGRMSEYEHYFDQSGFIRGPGHPLDRR